MSIYESVFRTTLQVHAFIYDHTDGLIGHRMLRVPCLMLRTTGRKTACWPPVTKKPIQRTPPPRPTRPIRELGFREGLSAQAALHEKFPSKQTVREGYQLYAS